MQTMKDTTIVDISPRFRAKTTEFDQTATHFYEGPYTEWISGREFSGKIAEFKVAHDVDGAELHSWWVLIDGGEPPTSGDLVLIYFWGPDIDPTYPKAWMPFFDPEAIEAGTADGNVQVHLAGE